MASLPIGRCANTDQSLILLLLLYIAVGGRFGLEYALGNRGQKRGNYGEGNVYERYGEQRGGRSVGSEYNDEADNVKYYDA
jgi:hypothetical protein